MRGVRALAAALAAALVAADITVTVNLRGKKEEKKREKMFTCNFPEFVHKKKTGGKVLDWSVNLLVTVSTFIFFLCVQVAWCDGKRVRVQSLL